jgi:hypothetical protein
VYNINTTKEKTVTQKKVAENRPMPYLLNSGSMINIVKDKSALQDYKDHQIVITGVSGQKPVSEGKGKMIFHVGVENIRQLTQNVDAYYPDNDRCMSNFLKKIFPIGQLRSCGQLAVPEDLNIAMRLLTDNCILTPNNAQVRMVNSMLLERVSGQEMTFEASDEPGGGLQLDRANMMHRSLIKRMNAYRNSCFPDPIIQLKVGAPVMLIRNLSPAEDLVNGTRLIVTDFITVDNAKCVECTILNGVRAGTKALFHRIDFHHDFEDSCPIDFVRRQFPLRLCFAMTINMSQGQTFAGRVGIYLKKDVFAHGHLYVALSRATSPRNIYLCHPPTAGREQQELKNIVAPDVTDRLRRNDAAADPPTPIEH